MKRASDFDGIFIEKSLKIDRLNLKIQTPFKLLEGKEIDPNGKSESTIIDGVPTPIFEIGKRIYLSKSWKRFHYLTQEAGNEKISELNKFFSMKKGMQEPGHLISLSPVFFQDPCKEKTIKINDKDKGEQKIKLNALTESEYESFLYYLHAASSAFVLSPDLKIWKKRGPTIDSYLDFVDMNMNILASRNSKPIFSPIQIDEPTPEELRKILTHYKKNGYANIWVNFNSREWCCAYFAKIRSFLSEVDRIFGEDGKKDGLNRVCIHYSHVRKENGAHPRADNVLSSDIFSQFFCGDFIGTNQPKIVGGGSSNDVKEKKLEEKIERGEYNSKEEYEMMAKANMTRIFHPSSYYYSKIESYPDMINFDKNELNRLHINRIFNSVLLKYEIERTKEYFGEKHKINPYLKGKMAIRENPNILGDLIPARKPSQQTTLADLLGNL